MSSIKSYGKIDESEQARLDNRRKTRTRVAIISLSSIVLVCVVVAAVVGTTVHNKSGGNSKDSAISTSVKAVCDVTLYQDSCYSSLGPLVNSSNVKPEEIFNLAIQVAINELSKAATHFSADGVLNAIAKDTESVAALKDCQDLLSLALDHLNDSLSDAKSLVDVFDDLKTWLSSSGTYQQTCIEGFDDVKGELKDKVVGYLKNSNELTSNSLAIVSWISKFLNSVNLRRLLTHPDPTDKYSQGVPEWLHRKDRKLLQSSDLRKKADIVVASNGSSKYKTIQDALKAVPDKSKKRTVIYVKKGVYYGNVRVEKSKWNVLVVGDGSNATIVTAKLNVVDGTPTFSTATFAVFGKGFIARDIGFRNTAGPAKHQAVALLSTADQSVFYSCDIDAFQDTLYAHSNRQFYRECNIYGTVDFIFGNSAVVLQNCNIMPRVPMPGQQNTITAQGKFDPNQNTGISIHNCSISPLGDLSSVKTFLGRPWKNYSTTVYMQTYMGNLISTDGWLPWVGNSAPDTVFYSEFQNFGPGASTKNRVKWKGLRIINQKAASKFTVHSFLQGTKWISDAGVTYTSIL
ncbi:pectinesterase/pectinesterase inhibitor 24 [Pyrus ussuriensis x Pyrus communis]|uniref:Pectinesterase n=1 Tax=Pyrus ussuriensis x Pyrus communis TaxID=2448454 RepID=A0A5N5HGW9_9ROSA|nr:pectinesterase/pectinesterase inhibitor 24 [Pyrus ussuriensis x Pyrus communis]